MSCLLESTRVIFVKLSGAVALFILVAACSMVPRSAPMPQLAVQLYSVKDALRSDFDGTFRQLAEMGYAGVEFAGQFGPYRKDPEALKAVLDRHHLACAGAHTPLNSLSPKNFDATISYYRTLGCRNLIIPSDQRAVTAAGAAKVALEISALSGQMAAQGMRIGYHNHAEEMLGPDGEEPWSVIGSGTPRDTIMQQDVGWTRVAGKDPGAMVMRFPGRTVSTHYKAKLANGESGTPIIGQDHADWAGLTRIHRQLGGTEWIIIEQEEYPSGMGQLEAVAASLQGLRKELAAAGTSE